MSENPLKVLIFRHGNVSSADAHRFGRDSRRQQWRSVLGNQLYVDRTKFPPALVNRIARLAARPRGLSVIGLKRHGEIPRRKMLGTKSPRRKHFS
jgi:hypothetical protein